MSETFLVLEQNIREDLEAIDRLFAALAPARLRRDTSQDECVLVGYKLHNLYNAFENIFRNVAHAFENTLEDRSGWHAELLRRMRLDLTPVRPALIDADSYGKLDELRRFRHLFRSLYTDELDPLRMKVALEKARALEKVWPPQIHAFLEFLRSLRSTPSQESDS